MKIGDADKFLKNKMTFHRVSECLMVLKRVLLCWVCWALSDNKLLSAKFQLVDQIWLEVCFGSHGGKVGIIVMLDLADKNINSCDHVLQAD